MEWPQVTVVIVTYNRPEELRKTYAALRDNLCYDGKIVYHLADDHSPDGYLLDFAKSFPSDGFTFSVTDRKGWGANVNNALRTVTTKYVFLCEDDYVAKRPLNLTKGVLLLETCEDFGLVRYDGVSGHRLTMSLEEVRTYQGTLEYFKILTASRCLNCYSNRPHLVNERFHSFYGLYPVGCKLGETEERFSHTVKDRMDTGPGLALLVDGIHPAFEHIGKSYQGTKEDING